MDCRIRFLDRASSSQNSITLKALEYDQELLASQRVGFSHDLLTFLSTFFDATQLDDLSITDIEYLQDLRDQVVGIRNDEFFTSFRRSSGLSFLVDLNPSGLMPLQFGEFLGTLEYEEARIVLLFLGDVFRFSMAATSSRCPFCPVELHAVHLFTCPFRQSLPTWQSALSSFHRSDWPGFVNLLFLCLQGWLLGTHFFQPRFAKRVSSYLSLHTS